VQLLTIEGLLSQKQRDEHPDYEPDLNFKKAKEEEHCKQMMFVATAVRADLAPALKRIEAIGQIKDAAKQQSELEALLADWPAIEAEVRRNRNTAKTLTQSS